MTAHIFLSCPEHPQLLRCDDDRGFAVDSVTSARALLAVLYPDTAAGKVSSVVLDCEAGGCTMRLYVNADTVEEARTRAATHNSGWYTARRSGGRTIDACQYHLGTCCVHHASPHSPTLDPSAVLPDRSDQPASSTAQLDLFALTQRRAV
ncbi:hypothetical protein ABT352_22710 [Streptosporangium sp. NPDC000563]|uniref:hypothetical protein n=1 Tax=Streptosporangium sp. NPDC000563 TaxID=3154366 RepID=UPI003318FC7F